MRKLTAIVLALAAAPAAGSQEDWKPASWEKELAPVACFVGSLAGKGSSPIGDYEETMTGEWANNKTVIVVRSKSSMDGTAVFEDVRIFSWDDQKKRIRARQFGMGDLAVYDVDVRDGGRTLVLNETAHEGRQREEWRYTFRLDEAGFRYVVDAKGRGGFAKYVEGSLKPAK